ncbi:MAG: MBL fold metallo-hydrolase [Bacteroidia bacterium]|nr:MBL fold metallo-hydrolase [Bacteroidia bacterium]
MKLQFFGAARMVTGSKHLLTLNDGTKILLDCGLVQGKLENREDLNRKFGFNPAEVDYLILSHAHIDHSGLIPRLVREGFNGIIFCTAATHDLCKLMLMDSSRIQEDDIKYLNKRRIKKGLPPVEPLYEEEDVSKALSLIQELEYDQVLRINANLSIHFTDAGHLLGSACVHLKIRTAPRKFVQLSFTGDIGKYGDSILRDPQPFSAPDYLICESTYGNKLHPTVGDAREELLSIIKHTCIDKKGKLIIPAFSVDRTQEIIYLLDQAWNEGLLPNIPVYVDSPLSVKATDVMREHNECYRDEFLDYIAKDSDPFGFKNLKFITDVEESKTLNAKKEPCIIISASGMAEAGRIKHHIANNIQKPSTTILLVGYCTPESLGGRLKSGASSVRIFGDEYPVKAEVRSLDYYSAHADYVEMLKFLGEMKPKKVRKLFLVHGEYDNQLAFKERLLDAGFRHIFIPGHGESFDLN